MAKTDFQSVDQYIAAQPEATRAVLERVRAVVREALPGADEVISYQIPAYRQPGGAVIYFAGWQKHYSLYPATERVVAECAEELAPYEIAKGTIRFPLSQPVPVELIARITRLRANEVDEHAKAKAAARKRAPRRPP
jgi:uncharacterized protein YdhG (YjbR/CyaY superfamily)